MTRQHRVNPVFLLIPLVILTIIVYLPTTQSFIRIWTDKNNPNYSHGLLLLGVSIFFIFRTWRENKDHLFLEPYVPATAGILVTSLLWLVACLGNIQIIQLICLLLIITLLFISLLGMSQTRLFLFALLVNIFSIPVWDVLNTTLRIISTDAVSALLNLVNILHVTEGFNITIRSGSFLVDTGCSGLGQLIAALSIGYIYGFMQPFTWRARTLLILLAAMTAIITNIIRIFIVVVSGYLTDMKHYFVTVDHVKLGWFVFVIGISCYFYAVNRFFGTHMEQEHAGTTPTGSLTPKRSSPANSNLQLYTILILAVLATTSGPLLSLIYKKTHHTGAAEIYTLPAKLGNWQRTKFKPDDFHLTPEFTGMDTYTHVIYENPQHTVMEVHLISYTQQSQGNEAISDLNKIYKGHQWQELQRRKLEVPARGNMAFDAEETMIEAKVGKKMLIWKWYVLNDTWTANTAKARLMNIWGILNRNPEISVFIIATDADSPYQNAHDRMQDFALTLRGELIKSPD